MTEGILVFSHLQKHACMWTGYSKFSIGLNEGLWSPVYSHYTPGVLARSQYLEYLLLCQKQKKLSGLLQYIHRNSIFLCFICFDTCFDQARQQSRIINNVFEALHFQVRWNHNINPVQKKYMLIGEDPCLKMTDVIVKE